jgi:hypothetical protein
MNIRIVVAAHKKYDMPSDDMYLALHVGCAGKEGIGFLGDDTGDNISRKNPSFCELTGLYWAWKNLDADYIGLVHYRRHFSPPALFKRKTVIGRERMEALLAAHDVVLPRKRHYFIETNYSQYAHAHHAIDLDTTRQILSERYPGYVAAFDRSMKKTSGHRFNMFVMKRSLLDDYCRWLFDILFELEKRLDTSGYSANDARAFGFVAERLLDVWLETNGIRYAQLPVFHLESQRWPVKIRNFLWRKFARGRREGALGPGA